MFIEKMLLSPNYTHISIYILHIESPAAGFDRPDKNIVHKMSDRLSLCLHHCCHSLVVATILTGHASSDMLEW